MMEHIRQFDWCVSTSHKEQYFVDEEGLDDCVTERILSNRFRDPMISSDSETEGRPIAIDFSSVFKQKEIEERQHRIHVPGFHRLPPYPKVSALNVTQQFQCLKVLCAQNPEILKAAFIPRPIKKDYNTFEELKDIYAKEQEEYIEWAKTMWTNSQCVRALRPKPTIEMVYEAEFKLKANELESFPKYYEMAAQIPLDTRNHKCEIIYNKDLISVSAVDLPQVQYPELTKHTSILRPYTVPEPCNKHPCRFVLPNDKSMSILPLTEVHRELAQYALDNGARHVASERALRCLVELDKPWAIPLTVSQVISADGEKCNVIVMGSDFSVNRECAQTRTYKAYRHMLEYCFISASQSIVKGNYTLRDRRSSGLDKFDDQPMNTDLPSSDDDDDHLVIDADVATKNTESDDDPELNKNLQDLKLELNRPRPPPAKRFKKQPEKECENSKKNEFYKCTCQDSMFENPPPRSFKKWQIKNKTAGEAYSIIVHTSHKARGRVGEVILEPIPEYQLELGGSTQSEHKVKSLALSLLLRRNASLLNVRVEGATGEVVTIDSVFLEDYLKAHGDVLPGVANTLYTALDQLQGLVPGYYILQHESSHGSNAFLYTTRMKGHGHKLSLHFDCSQLAESDEAKSVKTPPSLAPVLLPLHKFRKILPCAFTPHELQVAKETKKQAARQKTPPQAIQWPRRRKTKKKQNNGTQ